MRNFFRILISASTLFALVALPLSAVSTTTMSFTVPGGTVTFNVPNDLVSIVSENKSQIESALSTYMTNNGKSQSDIQNLLNDAQTVVDNQYDDFMTKNHISNPYTTAVDGINDFCESLEDAIPNAQALQNIWAESWIGYFIPNLNFGFGINAGAASLDIKNLKSAADALSIDTKGLNDTLAFPTATADIRVGGFLLPFDVGFTCMSFDTTKIDALDKKIDPVTVDYFSVGGDLRYRIFDKGFGPLKTIVSLTGGGYYTKGEVYFEDSKKNETSSGSSTPTSAKLNFDATTLFAGAQASAKVFFLVPFIGGRALYTKTNVDWKIHADWTSILSDSSTEMKNVISWGILPSDFSGGSSSNWEVRPQIYGGLGLDFFKVNVQASASYDFKTKVYGGAVSLRIDI